MNQIARGGYSLTPPVGGTTGVPLASGLRGQRLARHTRDRTEESALLSVKPYGSERGPGGEAVRYGRADRCVYACGRLLFALRMRCILVGASTPALPIPYPSLAKSVYD